MYIILWMEAHLFISFYFTAFNIPLFAPLLLQRRIWRVSAYPTQDLRQGPGQRFQRREWMSGCGYERIRLQRQDWAKKGQAPLILSAWGGESGGCGLRQGNSSLSCSSPAQESDLHQNLRLSQSPSSSLHFSSPVFSSPQPFWHQGPISWKTIFPQTGWAREWFWDDSNTQHLLWTLFILLWHQFYHWSSGVRSWRLGTSVDLSLGKFLEYLILFWHVFLKVLLFGQWSLHIWTFLLFQA